MPIPPDVPILLVSEKTIHGWRVWCPHCAGTHAHSAEEGHRAAHCASGPFRDTGYWIADPDNPATRRRLHATARQRSAHHLAVAHATQTRA